MDKDKGICWVPPMMILISTCLIPSWSVCLGDRHSTFARFELDEHLTAAIMGHDGALRWSAVNLSPR